MGQQAHITTIHLRDGQNLISSYDDLGICDDTLKKWDWEIRPQRVVSSALAICVFASFDVAPQGAAGTWIEIVSVGVEFSEEEQTDSQREIGVKEKVLRQ